MLRSSSAILITLRPGSTLAFHYMRAASRRTLCWRNVSPSGHISSAVPAATESCTTSSTSRTREADSSNNRRYS
uniref:Putative secreted protein n=1 Tax=Anopheles triannulatus TaxID=58253 RepID=A0A2M4B5X0_9DIPT